MKNIKRIVAIICVILLVSMYVVTFIMSIVDHSASLTMFKGCVATTIFIPVAAYFYIWLHKYAMTRSGRKDYSNKRSTNNSSVSEDTSSDNN